VRLRPTLASDCALLSRLSAILTADVAGYSLLTCTRTGPTASDLIILVGPRSTNTARRASLTSRKKRCRGAVGIQHGMAAGMPFRIGINVADVIIEHA
jgi:hypothetical protein